LTRGVDRDVVGMQAGDVVGAWRCVGTGSVHLRERALGWSAVAVVSGLVMGRVGVVASLTCLLAATITRALAGTVLGIATAWVRWDSASWWAHTGTRVGAVSLSSAVSVGWLGAGNVASTMWWFGSVLIGVSGVFAVSWLIHQVLGDGADPAAAWGTSDALAGEVVWAMVRYRGGRDDQGRDRKVRPVLVCRQVGGWVDCLYMTSSAGAGRGGRMIQVHGASADGRASFVDVSRRLVLPVAACRSGTRMLDGGAGPKVLDRVRWRPVAVESR
jgi:hypothetical protein